MSNKGLSTDSYKGVRDFYPEDQFIQNYIFNIWRKSVESFGYNEYNASILEPADLYRAKSGEEIVNDQTYTFTDRGDREVTLRPEMTPTVARMIAAKQRDLAFPVRWYSIPNLFRYEQPQKGRLREHYQLNVDLFGVSGSESDIESISLAHRIMQNFGASDDDFVIYINDRRIINSLYEKFGFDKDNQHKISKLIDKKAKLPKETFESLVADIAGDKTTDFLHTISSTEKLIETLGETDENIKNLTWLIENLALAGVKNVIFNPLLMRGFDYYTGIVFEVFDTSPENNRSLFGGGRYDDLVSMFGIDPIPAFGFGMGDVTIRDFLVTHKLLPEYISTTQLHICRADDSDYNTINTIAEKLRANGVNISIDMTGKKIGDQIKRAEKNRVPFIMVVGSDEIKSGNFEVKKLADGTVTKATTDTLADIVTPQI